MRYSVKAFLPYSQHCISVSCSHAALFVGSVRMNEGDAKRLALQSTLQAGAISIFNFWGLNITYKHSSLIY